MFLVGGKKRLLPSFYDLIIKKKKRMLPIDFSSVKSVVITKSGFTPRGRWATCGKIFSCHDSGEERQ